MDVLGKALNDYYSGHRQTPLLLHNSYGETEEMPAKVFFRSEEDLPELETFALSLCKGKILDIGAGTGSHALILQSLKKKVMPMDISQSLTDLMRKRGLKKIIHDDIFKYSGDRYHTLLMLMNGIGLAGTIDRLKILLSHCKSLLYPGGQLLFDSSDIHYLYDKMTVSSVPYYGEVDYQYEYEGVKGDWFKWLYIDHEELIKISTQQGWITQIIFENEMDQYLARLTLM